MNGKIFIEP